MEGTLPERRPAVDASYESRFDLSTRRQPRDLTVVMPVFNEVRTIDAVLDRVLALPSLRELIVVDDGSSDGSRIKLEARSARFTLVLQPKNAGKGACVREGYRRASSPWVVVQDADLEYDPSDIERLLVIARAGAEVVYGSRYLGRPRSEWWHTLGNRSLTWFSNLLTGRHLTDMETCYKLLPSEVARRLPLRSAGFGIEPEITALLARRGGRIAERPVAYRRRGYAEGKKIGWKDAVRAAAVMLFRALTR